MSASVHRLPDIMTVAEFLDWTPPNNSDYKWELHDGVPVMMNPPATDHGLIQSEVNRLIGNHLADHPRCRIVANPGVQPQTVNSDINFREPDLAVTCEPRERGAKLVRQPLLVIEILSPSNRRDTWDNVRNYVSISSVQEILVLEPVSVAAHLLRRQNDGTWPANPIELMDDETAELASIDFTAKLSAFYRTV
jgi:Uma2 family endonuclease